MSILSKRATAGQTSIGLTISMLDPTLIEMAKAAGFDFCRIDCEHTLFDEITLTNMLRTARLLDFPCHIRVETLATITPILSMEVSGVVLPGVESAEQARHAVDALMYAPLGHRGMDGGTRKIRYGGCTRESYMAQANDSLDLVVQIESRKGLENIEEILSVDGITMVASGRADLSQALGVSGQKNHPAVLEAEERIVQAALRRGKILMLGADTPERVKELHAVGACCFVVGRDENLAFRAMKEHADRFKSTEN